MVFFRFYLWVAPHLLLALCLAELLRKRRYKEFPFFFSYIVLEEGLFAALIFVYFLLLHSAASLTTYRWILVIGTALSAILQLATLYEIGNSLILNRWYQARILRPLLRWAAALLLLTAATTSALFSQNGMQRVMNVFQVLNFSFSVINLGLLVVLILFTRALAVSWKSLPAGVVLGFGISSTVEMIASALISVLGKAGYVNLDYLRMGAYHACVLVWLVYTIRADDSEQPKRGRLQNSELEFWNQELQRMVER